MKIAVVGATGMVGQEMLRVIEARNLPFTELIPVASDASKGKMLQFRDKEIAVVTVNEALEMDLGLALFSAGGSFSKKFAPQFASRGTRVIDNSSAWRMEEGIKLIVPEINGNSIDERDMIIANPNCSTIQLVMTLWPLHQKFTLKRVVVSTYQSITGTGVKALNQMISEREGKNVERVYPHAIDQNCLPHCDDFLENGYTKEEMKLVNESRKIMEIPTLKLTATAVRVPVVGGHSESVNASFEKLISPELVREVLYKTEGIIIQDDPLANEYPMPLNSKGKDAVFVGRIRKDESEENAINMWIVADNLRKGAATNAVQIAEILINKAISA